MQENYGKVRGQAFVNEATGSARMIHLDGMQESSLTSHQSESEIQKSNLLAHHQGIPNDTNSKPY